MGVTRSYLTLLQSLLPPGLAWTREVGAELTALLGGLAQELARVDARGEDLQNEMDPRTAGELLAEWEEAAGLPDECSQPSTEAGRQQALHAKLAGIYAQHRDYYIELAARLGYTITINLFTPFLCTSPCTDPIRDWRWRCASEVSAASQGTEQDALLECAARRVAQGHTHVMFTYS